MENFLYILDMLASSFSCFPISFLFCYAKRCCYSRSTLCCQKHGAGKEFRLWSALKKKKKEKLDADVLKSSEKSYNEGGCALFNSQSTNIVSLPAVIYNAVPYLSLLSLASSSSIFPFFFLLQESIYLCDWHKDFVRFEKQRPCRAISSRSSRYCWNDEVCTGHLVLCCIGSYCPPPMYLTVP